MRYLAVAVLAVVLFAAGYLAADLRTPDADAQGTWQFKFVYEWDAEATVVALPANCRVDFEPIQDPESHMVILAYSCPD